MKSIQNHKHTPLVVLAIFFLFWFGSYSEVFSQNKIKPPENWYCDERSKLLPNLRSGKVIEITKLKEEPNTDLKESSDSGLNTESAESNVADITESNKDSSADLRSSTDFGLISEFIVQGVEYRVENLVRIELTDLYNGKQTTEYYDFLNVSEEDFQAKTFKLGETYLFEVDSFSLQHLGKGTYETRIYFIPPNRYFKLYAEAKEDLVFFRSIKDADFAKEFYSEETIYKGVVNGRATSWVIPEYPESALKNNIAESIEVMIIIDEKGKVIKAKSLCAKNVELAKAAETAALASKFLPTLLSGKAVKVRGIIVYNFSP